MHAALVRTRRSFGSELAGVDDAFSRRPGTGIGARREALEREIRAEVGRARDQTYGEIAGPAPDPGDESLADLIVDLDTAEVTRDLGELRELDTALGRIAEGTYGQCVDCGRDIGLERLGALPTAVRCVDCQSVHEKTFAQPYRPRL
ncbi:MAG: TraR/DksA family transcriptional regulator [Burkholderiales bacterium]|nr:TraR/DksA family transcriptional regulator [Burkholderiales bacterium]